MTAVRLTRLSVVLGLSVAIPVMVWLLAQPLGDTDSSFREICQNALRVTALTEAFALALFSPWAGWHVNYRHGLGAVLLLALIPLPLYALYSLGGAATVSLVGKITIASLVTALAFFAFARGIARFDPGSPLSDVIPGCIQVMLAISTWVFQPQWAGFIGL